MAIKSLIFTVYCIIPFNIFGQWCYHKGDDKGLDVSPPSTHNCFIVTLPHSVIEPNTALWYSQILQIDENIYAEIIADDGAQLFQDGKRVLSVDGNYFLLKRSKASSIQIRVLNNAMSGGLKQVKLILPKDKIIDQHEVKPAFIAAQNQKLKYNHELKKISFSFWSDSQSGWPVFNNIVSKMKNFKDDFSIGLGDLVNNGYNQREWNLFDKEIIRLSEKFPVFTIPGNHDYDGYYDDLTPVNYYKYTSTNKENSTYYSFLYGNSYFIALDPNKNFPIGIDALQKQWLRDQVKSNEFKNSRWRFILIHQPPYAQGWAGYEGEPFIREIIKELELEKSIDFVLSGHNHDYERSTQKTGDHQITYIIAGGAGGGLEQKQNSTGFPMDKIIKKHHFCRMELSANNASLITYDMEGTIIDEFNISKK